MPDPQAAPALAWMPVTNSANLEGDGFELTRLGMPLADYLAAKEVSGRAAKTLRDKRAYIGAFALMWPNVDIEDVEYRHVVHYLAESKRRGLSGASMRIRYTHLNDFFEWCEDRDLIAKNPMRTLEAPRRANQKVYDLFSEAEVEALESLPLIDGCLLTIMFEAGLRRSECAKLQVRHVRGEPAPYGEILVIGGKGNKDRAVQMNRKLSTAIALLRIEANLGERDFLWYTRVSQGRVIKRDRAIGDGSFQRWWVRVLEDAGVKSLNRNPHLTRHTMATRWLRKGGRLETLSMMLGHSSMSLTKDLYGHLDSTDVLADLLAMEALDGD